jgi:hypothetical protein
MRIDGSTSRVGIGNAGRALTGTSAPLHIAGNFDNASGTPTTILRIDGWGNNSAVGNGGGPMIAFHGQSDVGSNTDTNTYMGQAGMVWSDRANVQSDFVVRPSTAAGTATEKFRVSGDTGNATFAGTINSMDIAGDGGGRIVQQGSGDNEFRMGCYNDDGWAYLESVNNANGIYFNAPSYQFDTGHLGAYTDGEVDLGYTSHRFRNLNISGDATIEGEIQHSSGRIQTGVYYFDDHATSGIGYYHFKTNDSVTSSWHMVNWHMYGYAYGAAAIVDSHWGYYNNTTGALHSQCTLNKGSVITAHSTYISADDFVVLVAYTSNRYYNSVFFNIYNSAISGDTGLAITADTITSSATGAY